MVKKRGGIFTSLNFDGSIGTLEFDVCRESPYGDRLGLLCRSATRAALTLATAISLPANAAAATCSSVTIAPLSFGVNLSPGGAAVTVRSSTTISIKCSGATSFSLLLDQGTHATGSGLRTIRRLVGAAGSLAYGLFQDGSRMTPWGDGRTVGGGESALGDGAVQPFVVYALLSVPATTAAGSYSDSVSLTVSF